MYRDLRSRCPVAWTEAHDGYWVVGTLEDVISALRDEKTYSSAKWQDEDGQWRGGDVIPDASPLPLDINPPEWNVYRRVLNTWLSPPRARERQPLINAYAAELLDRVIESGRCDLIADYANPLPALVTLEFIGLEVDDWKKWAEPFHAIEYSPPGSPGFAKALEDIAWQSEQLMAAIDDRRRVPRDDLVTAVAETQIDGHPLALDDGAALILTAVGGGVDTTTATVANGLLYLSEHPDARAWLLEDLDSRLPSACEEFLLWFLPVVSVARTVTQQTELVANSSAPGERAAFAVVSANHDDAFFEAPEQIQLDRKPTDISPSAVAFTVVSVPTWLAPCSTPCSATHCSASRSTTSTRRPPSVTGRVPWSTVGSTCRPSSPPARRSAPDTCRHEAGRAIASPCHPLYSVSPTTHGR
jgi:cytochrome P450